MTDIQWINGISVFSSQSALPCAFCNLISTHGLFHFVNVATRISASADNILDLLFSNSQHVIHSVVQIPGISDNECVVAHVTCPSPQALIIRSRKVYLYERSNYNGIMQTLEEYFQTFEALSVTTNIADLWSLFKGKLTDLDGLHIPYKILTGKQIKHEP